MSVFFSLVLVDTVDRVDREDREDREVVLHSRKGKIRDELVFGSGKVLYCVSFITLRIFTET